MNESFFNEQITGNWIVQSTNYSSRKNSNCIDTFTNQVKYTRLINTDFYLKLLPSNLDFNISKNKIDVYSIEYSNTKSSIRREYLFILGDSNNQITLFKFNHKFEYLNKFIVDKSSKKYLSIVSNDNSNIKIIEKIYLFNNNLKVIKTIVKKNYKDIAVSFSSEIRIS